MKYCGHVVDPDGVHKDPSKFEALDGMSRSDVSELRSFIAFINYYNRFIPNLSEILFSLLKLSKKEEEFVWSDEHS